MNLKEKVINRENIFGSHVTIMDPIASEIIGYSGVDFVWVDTEHSPLSYENLQNHISSLRMSNIPVIVRVHVNDYNHVKLVLEMGVDGLIFPMISSAEDADNAMKSCMYPPDGKRGFGPGRAIRFGFDDIGKYIREANRKLCKFIQIETIDAINNLEEIIQNPHIDGFIFGPNDLSFSLGCPNDVFNKINLTAIEKAIKILKSTGKTIGLSTGSIDTDVLQKWRKMGINMISAGADYLYMVEGAKKYLSSVAELKSIDNN